MATPLSSSEESQIQAVDTQLERYIEAVQRGNADPNDLVHIHNTLMNLAMNPRIPQTVQYSLQQVLVQLKDPINQKNLENLQSAKSQVDTLLTDSSNG